MKYLNDYIEDAITEAMDKAGAFYCFGQKQFNKQKQKGVKYVSLGAGLVSPKETYEELLESMGNIIDEGRKQDLKENKRRGVVMRELNNREAFYTGDINETVEALEPYNIKRAYVLEVYNTEKSKS